MSIVLGTTQLLWQAANTGWLGNICEMHTPPFISPCRLIEKLTPCCCVCQERKGNIPKIFAPAGALHNILYFKELCHQLSANFLDIPEPQIRLTVKRRTIVAAGGLVRISKNGTPAAAVPCDWDETKSDHAILCAPAKMAYPFTITMEL